MNVGCSNVEYTNKQNAHCKGAENQGRPVLILGPFCPVFGIIGAPEITPQTTP